VDELTQEITEVRLQIKRADLLLRGLATEKQKWVVCTRTLTTRHLTVTGDVLLCSAVVCLLSGFTAKHRAKYVEKWQQLIAQQGILVSDSFDFNEILGDQLQISEWQLNGLNSDSFSV